MVEPLASIVCNTLLSGRSRLNSVVRTVVTSSPRSDMSSIFFTPEPRRVKGKNKLEDNTPEALLDRSLRDWSSSSSRHLFCWPLHTHLVMLDELLHGGQAAPTKRRPKRPPKPRPRTVRSLPTSPNNAFQRRYASHATQQTYSPPSIPEPSDPDAPALPIDYAEHRMPIRQRLQRIIKLLPSRVDLDYAWRVYQVSMRYRIPPVIRIIFLEKYLQVIQNQYESIPSGSSQDELHLLLQNAQIIFDALKPFVVLGSRFDHWMLCILARISALRGDFEGATNAIREADDRPIHLMYKEAIIVAYDIILKSIARKEGNTRAMEYMVDQWKGISCYFHYHNEVRNFSHHVKRKAESLWGTAVGVATTATKPLSYLTKDDWSQEHREAAGWLLIEALSEAQLSTAASQVYSRMRKLHLRVRRKTQFALIRGLARIQSTLPNAFSLYESLKPQTEPDLAHTRLGLFLYAQAGNIEVVQDYFDSIKANTGSPNPNDIALLIHGYAMAHDVKRAEETFEEFFPCDRRGRRKNAPKLVHYATVINAHAQKGSDHKRISFWIEDLTKAKLVPNEYIFTTVLTACAAAGDLDSAMAVFEQMRTNQVKPNAVAYTVLITLLAHRRDTMGAEALFKRALNEGVIPDNRMTIALMNAYVEGGSWQGVIRAYDYLRASNVNELSLEVYNTLMKAYVLIGAPFKIVYKLFKLQLQRQGIKPDVYTYSLLVQSACDDGSLDAATKIYYEMKESYRARPDSDPNANVYVLTILMAGYLQHGEKDKAQAVYQEMLRSGVKPSPITYRTMLEAYSNERSKKNLEVAEQFIKSLVAVPEEERTWKKPKYDNASPLYHLYGPVLHGWARMKSPEDVERVFQDLKNSGATPNIGNLAALLDVYRRTFNIDAVHEIWSDILQLGLELTSKDWMMPEDSPSEITRKIRGNVLSVPLSIYIDALSAAGEHTQITMVWKDLRSRGFSFDSHNWNHLAVAMVRAGEFERAFETVERVIMPYQELSINSHKKRDCNPSTPLLSDVLNERQEDEEDDEVPSVRVMRSMHRQVTAKLNRERTRDMENFRNDDDSHDFAYHLHILHQISPSWATWRAHRATLTVLLIVLNNLHEGRLIRPLGAPKYDDEDEDSKAREMLHRIYDKYPKTVKLVLEHDEKERRMLTSDEYNERYKWD